MAFNNLKQMADLLPNPCISAVINYEHRCLKPFDYNLRTQPGLQENNDILFFLAALNSLDWTC